MQSDYVKQRNTESSTQPQSDKYWKEILKEK